MGFQGNHSTSRTIANPPGVNRMKSLARCHVWWPKLDQAIEDKVKMCEPCQTSRLMPAVAPLHPWEFPKQAGSRLYIDHAGPFLRKTFLIVFSKWHITPSTSSEATNFDRFLPHMGYRNPLLVTMLLPSPVLSSNSLHRRMTFTISSVHHTTPLYQPSRAV